MRDGPDVACRASRRLLAFGRLDDIFACWPRKFRRFQGETARDVTATVWHAHLGRRRKDVEVGDAELVAAENKVADVRRGGCRRGKGKWERRPRAARESSEVFLAETTSGTRVTCSRGEQEGAL